MIVIVMKRSPFRGLHIGALLLLSVFGAPAQAESLKVIELFTSQGCSSCPPADRLLGELIEHNDDVIALEYHVDYWDTLVYGSAGQWKDPYSSPDYSRRQRQYARVNLAGSQGVYTPQAVINGRYATTGSNRRNILKRLGNAKAPIVDVVVQREGTDLQVNVADKSPVDAFVTLVHYLTRTETAIKAGENKGVDIVNHHVVTDVKPLGELKRGESGDYTVAYAGGDNRGCAVIVQAGQLGPIMGAARCP